MIVSTKGRYALRVMVCLAQSGGEEYVPLKEIAVKILDNADGSSNDDATVAVIRLAPDSTRAS